MYIVISDKRGCPEWDPAKPLRDQTLWHEHATFMDGLVEAGVIVFGGTFAGDERALLVVDAASEDAVRSALADDPWLGSHLQIESVEPFTLRLDPRG